MHSFPGTTGKREPYGWPPQTNLIIGDIYTTLPELSVGSNSSIYGLNLVPTIGWAVDRNWVIGGQATLGFWHDRRSPQYAGAGTDIKNYYDFGVAPLHACTSISRKIKNGRAMALRPSNLPIRSDFIKPNTPMAPFRSLQTVLQM